MNQDDEQKQSNDEKKRQDTEVHRHHCEVLSVVRMYNENDAGHVSKFLLQVEKHRGTDAANRLRTEAWEKIKHDKQSKTIQAGSRRGKTKSR